MGRSFYVFINWKTKDVVSTTSYPGAKTMGFVNTYTSNQMGPRAKQLIADGYTYFGRYTGFNATIIEKHVKD